MSEIIEFPRMPEPAQPERVTSYDLMAVAAALTAYVMACEEEPTQEQVDWFNEQVFGLAEDTSLKLRNIRYVLQDHIAKAEFIRQEEVRLARRRKALNKSVERLRALATELLQASSEVTGQRSVTWHGVDDDGTLVPMGRASLRRSTRVPNLSQEDLEHLKMVAPDLVDVKLVADKTAIRADLKHKRRELPFELEDHEYIHFS